MTELGIQLIPGRRRVSDKALYIENLESMLDAFPPNSILSRTIYQDNGMKTILFAFQPGQELSEHTASVPAVLHFLKGSAELVLGQESKSAKAGTWIHIPPHLSHSILALEKTLMLLTLLS